MTRLAAAVLAVVAILSGPVLAQNPAPTTFALGSSGEVTHWLALGYVPLAIDQNSFDKDLAVPAKVLDADLLAAVGGEGKVQPVGGQKVKLAAGGAIKTPVELAWRLAATRDPVMYICWSQTQGLKLFFDEKGQAREKSACYLYCQLVSPSDLHARFRLGSDDSVRVMLNGQVVHRFVGQRSAVQNDEEASIQLHKGVNELLVRVDNYVGGGGFFGRLVNDNGLPLDTVKEQLAVPAGTADLPPAPPDAPWSAWAAKIHPPAPAEHQEFFGARIPRTMSLLETGAQTHRPVKIMIYGQSIEVSNWPDLLILQLQERYPHTNIIGDNEAIGGWNVGSLLRVMDHDIIRAKPDLVIFHAYQGTAEQWDRFIQKIRRETTAELMIRTSHIASFNVKTMDTVDDEETFMLHAIAQKYDIEMVDVRREWLDYLHANKLDISYLLRDMIHLNEPGCILMSELYARHFRSNLLSRSHWMNTIRSYNVLRPMEDRKYDEITLAGGGWRDVYNGAQASGAGNSLKLKFTGNRVDLVLLPDSGSARVLIDGNAPSHLNLFHGERPVGKDRRAGLPMVPQRYHTGSNMIAEEWELTFTEFVRPGLCKFSLRGSVTGEDGQGSTIENFVSKSGRIIIDANDWRYIPDYKPNMPGQPKQPAMILQIARDYLDQVSCLPDPGGHAQGDIPYQYVTIADGLSPGEHELTLIPSDTGSFSIQTVEVHNPPMMRK
jgi:hypothetical protein